MKISATIASLLLLFLPVITNAAAAEAFKEFDDSAVARDRQHAEEQESKRSPPPAVPDEAQIAAESNAIAKELAAQGPRVGREGAPVDGLDGKPHEGPWVDGGASDVVLEHTEEPAGDRKPGRRPLSSSTKPVTEMAGVMNDPNREGPKQGTTGTEGGVTETSREHKAKELESGKQEKMPEQPKAAPPLPHSEELKIEQAQKEALKSGADVSYKGEKPIDVSLLHEWNVTD
jgi:hypothetical protein